MIFDDKTLHTPGSLTLECHTGSERYIRLAMGFAHCLSLGDSPDKSSKARFLDSFTRLKIGKWTLAGVKIGRRSLRQHYEQLLESDPGQLQWHYREFLMRSKETSEQSASSFLSPRTTGSAKALTTWIEATAWPSSTAAVSHWFCVPWEHISSLSGLAISTAPCLAIISVSLHESSSGGVFPKAALLTAGGLLCVRIWSGRERGPVPPTRRAREGAAPVRRFARLSWRGTRKSPAPESLFKNGGDEFEIIVGGSRQPCFKANHRFAYNAFHPHSKERGTRGSACVCSNRAIWEGDAYGLSQRLHPRVQRYLYRETDNTEGMRELIEPVPELGAEIHSVFLRWLERSS
ncbi:hypothetical protein PG997_008824 [Apiospora hydei]|uniref:Uncharacterized protein n=1 Tax=Apiospora hydei TaxID=1337664 RepID=A0ABR1WES6_9PEZI